MFAVGSLQNFARRYKIPIDQLSFQFDVLDEGPIDKQPVSFLKTTVACVLREFIAYRMMVYLFGDCLWKVHVGIGRNA